MANKKKKKLNKRLTYLMSGLAILAAVAMAMMIVTSNTDILSDEETTLAEEQVSTVGYESHIKSEGETDYPLLPTDIDGVLVKVSPAGAFEFFEYGADPATGTTGLVACTDTKTLETEVTCSSQKIPATIYYIEREGKVTGCGLFTTAISDADVKLYEYALFKLVTMPEGYGKDDAMLLVDFDKDDFTSTNRTYSEVFGCDLSSGKTQRLTSENGRLVDEKGRMRTDWNVLTDHFLKTCGVDKYYLSGRNYNLNHMAVESDIIMCPDTSKTKPSLVVKGIAGTYLTKSGDSYIYIMKTEEGLNVVNQTGQTQSVTATLAGDMEDYLFSSDWLLEKTTLKLTNLLTGVSIQIASAVEKPTAFSVSPDGNKAVLFKADGKQQTLAHCDLNSGSESVSAENGLFAEQYPFVIWVSDSEYVIHSVADGALKYTVSAF